MMRSLFLSIVVSIAVFTISNAQTFTIPKTEAKPVTDELHGMGLTDPYRWLEDKTDENVNAWTHAQHDATVDFVNSTCNPIDGLRDELRAYIDRDIISPMSLVADRQFFTMKKQGDAQSKLFTRYKGKDILLFDPEKIDPTGKTSMSGRSFSKKGEKVAVGVQVKGAEIRTYYIIDTKTGNVIGKPIEGLRGFSWTDDEKHAYIWIRTQEMIDAQKPYEIYLHKLGSPRSSDQFLLKPTNAKNVASIYDSRWSDLTFYSLGDFYATHSLKMKKTGSRSMPVEIYGDEEFRVSPFALNDQIYFFTNHEAPNYKIMVTDKNSPGFKNWKELIPEGETVIENFDITDNQILVQDKKDIVSRIHVYDKNGKYVKQLPMPEIGNVSFMNYNRDVKKVFVGLTSFATPFKIYSLEPDQLLSDMPDWTLFYEQEVPINTDNIEGKVDFFTSKDGTRVPLIIVHKKGLELDGNNPTLLNGYGGFNIGMSPSFVGSNAMFINRGGVFAIACIRGGDEYGESWHKDGMLFNKHNTFDDFIAAGEYLIDQGYTSTEKLGIIGGSNGGLLVGAVVTQRPDLFKMAWCAVPLLDMVRFPKFLIAQYWIPEYGDPEVAAEFRNILSYSPYHNVRMGIDHPTMIVTAGENDTRVDPLHAKKFVAALQNNPGQQNPIMLYMNFDSGHGSGKSTEQLIDEQEFRWRFIMNQLGIE